MDQVRAEEYSVSRTHLQVDLLVQRREGVLVQAVVELQSILEFHYQLEEVT